MGKELSIYVHIPFCKRKCLYCDFLSFGAQTELMEAYFDALGKELLAASDFFREHQVKSIFFGGGTPSFPGAGSVCRILKAIGDNYNLNSDAEISIEVNPASAMKEKLLAYRNAGFNRLSIGAQSMNDAELKMLGRLHDSLMFLETYDNAKDAGFDNINVDLMSALPGQSVDSYLSSLDSVIRLKPEHISAYSLIVEEETPFYEMDLSLPSEDEDRAMYHETKRILSESGYHRYEISNYARSEVSECRHNKVYWERGNYLGLGLGASSMSDNTRWNNISDIDEYIKRAGNTTVRENIKKLTTEEQMEEFMFLGLRLVKGIDINIFKNNFGRDINEIYGSVIEKYIGSGHLRIEGHNMSLTDEGLDVSNTVMADFLL